MIKPFAYFLLRLKLIQPISGFLPDVDTEKLLSPVTESPVQFVLGVVLREQCDMRARCIVAVSSS